MPITVSISDLRNNISNYLEQVSKGTRLFIRDEKKGKTIAQISQIPTFDNVNYERVLRRIAGIFTSENHPEWRTKRDVINWVNKNRLASERKF